MEKRRAVRTPLVSLIVATTVFLASAHADDSVGSARAREQLGLARGQIVDRVGRPLAYTATIRGTVRRLYSLPDLASVVGYRDPGGRWHGVEKRYSSFLDASKARTDWRTFFLHLRGQSVAGGTVELTIDRRLQRVADEALGHNKGAVVAIDPRTGGILALLTKPYCSAEFLAQARQYSRCRNDVDRPLENRALQLLVPPGSAFKIVTLSAAMDTRRFGLDSIFQGADAFGPNPYFDNVAYPSNVTRTDLSRLTLLQALAFSDNFTFAHIGLTLGARTLLEYAHRFHIGRRIPFDYPVAVSSIADSKSHPSLAEVAQSSFGAQVDQVTPLQMALISAAVANGGVMMAPHLIATLKDASGHVVGHYHDHPLDRVMGAQAARNVTTAMMFVVQHGSGFNAQISGVQVAGKTGTAASGASVPHAWFIAFAPVRHPVVAVAVLHEYSGEGFKYAAPIARKILVAALQERGYRVH